MRVQVYKALWRVQTVAVKMLVNTTEKQMDAFKRCAHAHHAVLTPGKHTSCRVLPSPGLRITARIGDTSQSSAPCRGAATAGIRAAAANALRCCQIGALEQGPFVDHRLAHQLPHWCQAAHCTSLVGVRHCMHVMSGWVCVGLFH